MIILPVITKFSEFVGERLSVNGDRKDLFVQSINENILKVTDLMS